MVPLMDMNTSNINKTVKMLWNDEPKYLVIKKLGLIRDWCNVSPNPPNIITSGQIVAFSIRPE